MKIKIAAGKTQYFNIPLSPEGGKLSGRIQLVNIKGEALPLDNLVLVLRNSEGKVLNYTVPDGSGKYQFGNISAGSYQVDLEAKLKASGRYQILQSPPLAAIAIPKSYEESIEVSNHNLKLLAL